MRLKTIAVALASACAGGLSASAQTASSPSDHVAREILKELGEIDTTHDVGITSASQAVAKRLIEAGFPPADVRLIGAYARNQNLVARLRGTGARKPLLLLAHIDVVEARREDWTVEPFRMIEQDGYFYGRGTGDDKAMAAIWTATLLTEALRPLKILVDNY